jgi:hypothetical protein
VYVATAAGLELAGLRLPPARVDLRTYEHDLQAVWLLLALEAAHGPAALVTERELRAADTGRDGPRYAAALGDRLPSGQPRLHLPDLAIVDEHDLPVAVELERTSKGTTRLTRIIRAYARARHLAGVRYYVTSPSVERAVTTAVRREAAEELIEVIAWAG